MKNTSNAKTAFVFAGGGSLGAVQVGMLKSFTKTGIKPDFIVGTSVGAINAAFFASDPSHSGANQLEQIWMTIRQNDIFPVISLGSVFAFFASRNYLCSPQPLKMLIEKNITYTRLEDAPVPCIITATDLYSGEEVVLSTGAAVDALLAGSAIPMVFPPVKFNGQYLVDGGITNNTPISVAVSKGATRVIVFPTGVCCAPKKPPAGLVEMALQTISISISHRLALDIEKFRSVVDIVLVPVLCPLDVSMFNFSKTRELIDQAEDNTMRWIENNGLKGGKDIDRLKPHSHG